MTITLVDRAELTDPQPAVADDPKLSSHWSDGGNGSHRPPENYGEKEWRIGWTDGRLGQIWTEMREVLKHLAEKRRLERKRDVEIAIKGATADAATATEALKRDEKELSRLEKQYEDISDHLDRAPSSYSVTVAVIFIVSAVVLMASDLPLSRMAAVGLGLTADDLIEQWAVAAGIAILGIIFKLIADPFTTPAYLLNKYVRVIRWFVCAIVLMVIVTGVSGAYILLGTIRNDARTMVAEDRDSGTTGMVTPPVAPPPAPVTAPVLPASRADWMRKLAEVPAGTLTFIAMALAIPIVGGILLSTGLSRLHNASRYRHVVAAHGATRARFMKTFDENAQKMATIQKLQVELTTEEKIPDLANSAYALYLHGYERGYTSPETLRSGEGMAQRVKHNVEKWLAIAEQRQNEHRTARLRLNAIAAPEAAPPSSTSSKTTSVPPAPTGSPSAETSL
jgi:hypothetical protein